MRIRSILGSALFFVAALALAQKATQIKEPWQLTDDERIAARLDPEKIRQRAASHAATLSRLHPEVVSSMNVGAGDGQAPGLIIDGAKNPELFLPFELFGHLLRGVDMKLAATDRQIARAILEPKIKAFGFQPDVFWAALGASTNRYFAARDNAPVKHSATAANSPPSGSNGATIGLCGARLTALNSAREHFGRDTFDRFLYTVVAPTLTVTSRAPGPDEASGLRYLSGGGRGAPLSSELSARHFVPPPLCTGPVAPRLYLSVSISGDAPFGQNTTM